MEVKGKEVISEGSKRYLEMYRMCDLKREKKIREKAGRNEEN